MASDGELSNETLQNYEGEFQVQDDSNAIFKVRWEREPTRVSKNPAGLSGWARRDGKSLRLHVCFKHPCPARYPDSKYGLVGPPTHVRLITTALVAATEKAIVASSSANPVCPLAPMVVETTTASPELAPTTAPQTPAVVGPGAESNSQPIAVLRPAEEVAASQNADMSQGAPPPPLAQESLDISQVAPPPPPPPKSSGTLEEGVLPPQRATLLPLPSAAPCPPSAAPCPPAAAVPQQQVDKPSAVAGLEDVLDEIVAVGELTNERVAAEMNKFIVELGTERTYVGVSAFLIFALRYRMRVCAWYGTRSEDLLSKYAPWASDSICHIASFQVVCCKFCDDGSLQLVEDDAQRINHWVGACPTGSGHSDSFGAGESEVTKTLYGTYLSLDLHILPTVVDGDCGIDALTLMLGWERSARNRKALRLELAAFAFKHLGNRAFIAMLYGVGELTQHLGLFELDSAGAEVLVTAPAELAEVPHHGDGGADAGTPQARGRNFSDEEMQALKWKCRLQHAGPEFVTQMLSRLPEECITRAIEEYRSRAIEMSNEDTPVQMSFLMSRDAPVIKKVKAAKAFVVWCAEKYGPLSSKATELLKSGRVPRGWFSKFVRAHPQLQKACCVRDEMSVKNKAYIKILRIYSSAVRIFLSTDSAVAEATTRAVVEHDADDYSAKFNYKVPRLGSQYFSTRDGLKRDWARRRGRGAGRRRTCTVLREMLITWYSTIRHSIDVKIMCRIPQKILLVKALELQQDYYCACLRNRIEPERVQVNAVWLGRFLDEYRISSRRPNRKFKVPRPILAERLKIFWIVTSRLRRLVQLTFGYDPKFRNIDQSPFHGNEAGSAESNTLVLKGAPTVPLIENHAATRDGVSLNSVTDSSQERISQELPGFELMFRAEG